MFKRRFKPTQRKIDLSRTIAQDLEFFCKTSHLDEILLRKLKQDFNKTLSEALETQIRFYFVVKKNSEYDILPGTDFEPWLLKNEVKDLSETPKAKSCIDHYIQKVYLQYQ